MVPFAEVRAIWMATRAAPFFLPPLFCLLFACSGGDDRENTPSSRETVDDAASSVESSPVYPDPHRYEVISFEDAGALTGTVRLSATVAPLTGIPVLKDQSVCGTHSPNPSLELGTGNGVANVIVSLVGVTQGKPMEQLPAPTKLDQVGCLYVPHVQIVPLGSTLDIANSDPILHNVHAYLNGTETVFNLAMPLRGYRIRRRLDQPGLMSLKCDAGHTWMSGYIMVQEHPYYALTVADGSYSIEDVPVGKYVLKLWHEFLGETEVPVEIESDTTSTVDLELNAPAIDPS